MKTAAALLVVLAGLVWFLWPAATARWIDPLGGGSSPTAQAHGQLDPPDVAGGRRPRHASAAAAEGAWRAGPAEGPAQPELVRLLAEIGAAERRGDGAGLGDRLPRVVGSGAVLLAVLTLLEDGALATNAWARHGAVVALSVGVARWSRGGGPPDRDGIELTTELLMRLPRLDAESREDLLGWLTRSETAGRPALDARYLDVVLALCRASPAEAEAYAQLLGGMASDPTGLGPHHATLWAALGGDQPAAVRAFALRGLFAIDPEGGSTAASELLAAARADPELRGPTAAAIAEGAPVDRAIELLVSLNDPSQHGAFAALAERPAARAAVREHYSRLAAAGLDPTGRKILVASMRGEDPELLLAIAESDPSPSVRQQAFLTGTLKPGEGSQGLVSLRNAYARRTDPHVGIPASGIVLAAENLVWNGRGPPRDGALELLAEIARDPEAALADRLLALRKLRPHVPAASIADLDGLGEDPRGG